MCRRLSSAGTATLVLAVLVLLASAPLVAADPAQVAHYELQVEWSVDAQGPVHLREKHVTASYRIDVTDVSPPGRSGESLRIHFAEADIQADIPAQKRSGSFDSRQVPEKLSLDHHELVRPVALWQQTFDLKYTPQHVLLDVTGAESAMRRLDELYDDHLRGTEQDLNTRAFERDRLNADSLRTAWAPLFLVSVTDHPPAMSPLQSAIDAEFIACIPSESWMATVELPLTETVTAQRTSDGLLAVTRSAVLARQDQVETTIGGIPWSYTPQEVQSLVKVDVQPDGRVQRLDSSAQAVLQTTLSLGMDVPITMTIRHVRSLKRR